MIAGSVEPAILALGVGNQLLSDDGVGLVLLQELSRRGLPGVECVDGGTQGLMLLGQLAGRSAVILLDAIRLGAPPGTVHSIPDLDLLSMAAGGPTSHEANAGDLLRAAALTGDLPEHVFVIGIEPDRLSTGIGLSEKVEAAVPAAVEKAIAVIEDQLY